MQADWEVEIGGEAPVIDAHWHGFIDLRCFPNRVSEISEIQKLPALADALVLLNAADSPVWTAKCDVWAVSDSTLDRFELDAAPEAAAHARACYIDMLPRSDQQWNDPQCAVVFCKELCSRLQSLPRRCCRIDLIVRSALTAPGMNNLGITAYLSACGSSEARACSQLEGALAAFVDALVPSASPASGPSRIK